LKVAVKDGESLDLMVDTFPTASSYEGREKSNVSKEDPPPNDGAPMDVRIIGFRLLTTF